MTNAEFAQWLERQGYDQSSFARTLIELGDPRSFTAVVRLVNNQARGETKVSGEMAVICRLMERARVKAPAPRRAGRPRKVAAE